MKPTDSIHPAPNITPKLTEAAEGSYEFDYYALLDDNEWAEFHSRKSAWIIDLVVGYRIPSEGTRIKPLLLPEVRILFFCETHKLNFKNVKKDISNNADFFNFYSNNPSSPIDPAPPCDPPKLYPDSMLNQVRVAILDTGFDLPEPIPAYVKGAMSLDGELRDRVNVSGGSHGSRIASVIAGQSFSIAKNAELYLANIHPNGGTSNVGNLIQGLYWAVEQKCKLACVSIWFFRNHFDARNDALERVMDYCLENRCLVCASIGNEDLNFCSNNNCSNCLGASIASVCYSSFSVSGFSGDFKPSRIPQCIDPFEKVDGVAQFLPVVKASNNFQDVNSNMSGTSLSTAIIAANAALFLGANPTYSASQLKAELQSKFFNPRKDHLCVSI